MLLVMFVDVGVFRRIGINFERIAYSLGILYLALTSLDTIIPGRFVRHPIPSMLT